MKEILKKANGKELQLYLDASHCYFFLHFYFILAQAIFMIIQKKIQKTKFHQYLYIECLNTTGKTGCIRNPS